VLIYIMTRIVIYDETLHKSLTECVRADGRVDLVSQTHQQYKRDD
jgi:hypothetical protein